MSERHLGKIHSERIGRDAVHICTYSVIAGEDLVPGQKVKLSDPETVIASSGPDMIGVIDPYIIGLVKMGNIVNLFAKPGLITSLTHSWNHPDFPKLKSEKETIEPSVIPRAADIHEQWLTNYAAKSGRTMKDVIREGNKWLDQEGSPSRSDFPSEFWEHFSSVTGRNPDAFEGVDMFCLGC